MHWSKTHVKNEFLLFRCKECDGVIMVTFYTVSCPNAYKICAIKQLWPWGCHLSALGKTAWDLCHHRPFRNQNCGYGCSHPSTSCHSGSARSSEPFPPMFTTFASTSQACLSQARLCQLEFLIQLLFSPGGLLTKYGPQHTRKSLRPSVDELGCWTLKKTKAWRLGMTSNKMQNYAKLMRYENTIK